jgi:hypothetical protein
MRINGPRCEEIEEKEHQGNRHQRGQEGASCLGFEEITAACHSMHLKYVPSARHLA